MVKRRRSALTPVALCMVLLTACSRPPLAAPTAPSPSAVAESRPGVAEVAVFPLTGGTFSIANGHGDGIAGTYQGTAIHADAKPRPSSLTLEISSGTGAFAGATGTLTLATTGMLSGDGTFALTGTGEITLAGGVFVIGLHLSGTSAATCSGSERIAIRQSATGTMRRAGRVTAHLSHEVGNTSCSG